MSASHTLFVAAGSALSLPVLRYVHSRLPVLGQMGITLRVHRVKTQSATVAAALQNIGVERLPALVTAGGVYAGLSAIRAIYERNIRAFKARRSAADGGDGGDGGLDSFLRRQIGGGNADADDEDDDTIGSSADMMANYQATMARRTPSAGPSAGPSAAPSATPSAGPSAVAKATPSVVALRPDNIAAGSAAVAASSSAAPGAPVSDDDAPNPQDDFMSRAYWDNQSET